MDFDIENGQIKRRAHSDFYGDIIGIWLACKNCNHRWRPRKARQITDLMEPAHDRD